MSIYVLDQNNDQKKKNNNIIFVIGVGGGGRGGTHNADSIIESKVIYYLEQCGVRV